MIADLGIKEGSLANPKGALLFCKFSYSDPLKNHPPEEPLRPEDLTHHPPETVPQLSSI
jgi:hypothetical protein